MAIPKAPQGIQQIIDLDKIEVIEGMLANGLDWSIIERITHLNQAGYES